MDPSGHFQQMPMQQQVMQGAPKQTPPGLYAPQSGYPDASSAAYTNMSYDPSSQQSQHDLQYTTVPPPVSVIDQQYAAQNVFPTPPMQHGSRPESSPEAYSPGDYQQQDLADLLGSLKVNETGTGKMQRAN